MSRIRRAFVSLVVVGVVVAAAQSAQPARRARRGGRGRSSLLGLVSMVQVQKDLGLNADQIAKVKKVTDTLNAEMRKKYTALREIEDRAKRTAKYTELRDQFDKKAREQLSPILGREKLIRLYQIRLQVRSLLESLDSEFVVERLKITAAQKKKFAAIEKDTLAKRTELFSSARNATQEQRSAIYAKYRTLRDEAEKKALAVLTAAQKKTFEELKGKKITLTRPQRTRPHPPRTHPPRHPLATERPEISPRITRITRIDRKTKS